MEDRGRDWLFVQSGTDDDDIGMLYQFLCGRPVAVTEVRDAIVRILHSGWDTLGVGKNLISILFDPEQRPKGWERPRWTLNLKRTSKGHPSPWRDDRMALAIQAVRDCGKSYQEAIDWAVKSFGVGERRAKQIYGKTKDRITTLSVRSVKSDT
jgi:hypothetical protein